jgi:hypothetical protein
MTLYDDLDDRELIAKFQHEFTSCNIVREYVERGVSHVEVECPVCKFKSTYPSDKYTFFACDGVTIRCGNPKPVSESPQ